MTGYKNCKTCFVWCCSVVLLVFFVVIFVVCLVVGLSSMVKHRNLASNQKAEVVRLKMKVEDLEEVCRWEKVLIQILPSIQKEELDLLEEQVKQRIEQDFIER